MSRDKQTKTILEKVFERVPEKKIADMPSLKNGPQKFKASKGFILPLFYKGSIIHIGEITPVEIDLAALGYEPKIQFLKALDQKHIIEVGE